jgi:hypothetical protein
MPVLQAGSVGDIITTTLNELGRGKLTDNISQYRNTTAVKRIFKKNKISFTSGPNVEFRVMTEHNNAARFTGLGYTAAIDIPSMLTKGTVPWRYAHTNWAVERRLVAMNRAPGKIFDYIKVQRIGAMAALVELLERALWRLPSASDEVTMYGIPNYVVKSNTAFTTTNRGMNGTVPSGYTTVAGLSPTTYPRWKNYAEPYTAVTDDDLVRKMRRAAEYTKFEPIVDDIPTYSLGDDLSICTNYSVLGTFEEIVKDQNESLGMSLDPTDGKAMFRRVPVKAVDELDNDTTNPVYGINWGYMHAMGMTGEWMKDTVFEEMPNQPTMAATFTDSMLNTICRDRRKQWVLATGTDTPSSS